MKIPWIRVAMSESDPLGGGSEQSACVWEKAEAEEGGVFRKTATQASSLDKPPPPPSPRFVRRQRGHPVPFCLFAFLPWTLLPRLETLKKGETLLQEERGLRKENKKKKRDEKEKKRKRKRCTWPSSARDPTQNPIHAAAS